MERIAARARQQAIFQRVGAGVHHQVQVRGLRVRVGLAHIQMQAQPRADLVGEGARSRNALGDGGQGTQNGGRRLKVQGLGQRKRRRRRARRTGQCAPASPNMAAVRGRPICVRDCANAIFAAPADRPSSSRAARRAAGESVAPPRPCCPLCASGREGQFWGSRTYLTPLPCTGRPGRFRRGGAGEGAGASALASFPRKPPSGAVAGIMLLTMTDTHEPVRQEAGTCVPNLAPKKLPSPPSPLSRKRGGGVNLSYPRPFSGEGRHSYGGVRAASIIGKRKRKKECPHTQSFKHAPAYHVRHRRLACRHGPRVHV